MVRDWWLGRPELVGVDWERTKQPVAVHDDRHALEYQQARWQERRWDRGADREIQLACSRRLKPWSEPGWHSATQDERRTWPPFGSLSLGQGGPVADTRQPGRGSSLPAAPWPGQVLERQDVMLADRRNSLDAVADARQVLTIRDRELGQYRSPMLGLLGISDLIRASRLMIRDYGADRDSFESATITSGSRSLVAGPATIQE